MKTVIRFVVLTLTLTGALAQPAGATRSEGPLLTIGDTEVVEGTDGSSSARFEVRLDKASGRIVTVDYRTVPGTAAEGSDYFPMGGTITFNKRQTLAIISVPIVSDRVDETDETFSVVLSNAAGGATIGDDTGIATILDDDEASAEIDLAVGLIADSASGRDFLVEDIHPVHFQFTNASGELAADVRVRLTFDAQRHPEIHRYPDNCQVRNPTEMLCSYGDTSEGGAGYLEVSYRSPATYTITATVESGSHDPAPGNDTRTSVLPVRNRRADLQIETNFRPPRPIQVDPESPAFWSCYRCAGEPIPRDFQCACGHLWILNAGPDHVSGFTFSFPEFSDADRLHVDLERSLEQNGATCDDEGRCETADSRADCTLTSCTVSFEQPLFAGEGYRLPLILESPAAGPDHFELQVKPTVAVSRNPDGSAVDEETNNNEDRWWPFVVLRRQTDLSALFGVDPTTPSVSGCRPNAEGEPAACQYYAVGVDNLGWWAATDVRVRVQIPGTVRVVTVPSGCMHTGSVAGVGGVLDCEFGQDVAGYENFVTGQDGYGWRETSGPPSEFVVEYLSPGEITFRVTATGTCLRLELDPHCDPDPPENDVVTITRTVGP